MNIKEKLLNKERSWTDMIILVFIQAYLWMQLGGLLTCVLIPVNKAAYLFTNVPAIAEDLGQYIISIGFWFSMVLGLLIFKKNRKLLRIMWPSGKINILIGAGAGLVAGFAINAAIVAGAASAGSFKLTFSGIELLPLIGYFIAILFQAGGEEIICRMFIMGKLQRRYKSPAIAIIGNSLFFTVFHLGNPGINAASILGVLMAGIMFSLIVYRFDNLWAAIGMHTAWNFTQTVIFGLPNSGLTSPFSIFKAENAVNGFCFDTGFGVEGSWCAVILLAVVAGVLVMRSGKCRKMIEAVR